MAKSFPAYVEFDSGAIKLALYKRAALARQLGCDQAGTGSHRLAIVTIGTSSDTAAYSDPDGYAWADIQPSTRQA